jgi:ABC-type multidrug transport system fused ATPase/permease subunit
MFLLATIGETSQRLVTRSLESFPDFCGRARTLDKRLAMKSIFVLLFTFYISLYLARVTYWILASHLPKFGTLTRVRLVRISLKMDKRLDRTRVTKLLTRLTTTLNLVHLFITGLLPLNIARQLYRSCASGLCLISFCKFIAILVTTRTVNSPRKINA